MQQVFPKFAEPVGQAQLKVTYAETKTTLPIVHASVKLTTRGPLVLVQQRLQFSNPHTQTLEGELIIPLPENASVCAFASQDAITGEMHFASIVGKEKARKAFETEVRHRGPQATLMEQIKGAGNTYKTRIYPIPANGTYTIEIHYTDSLAGSITWDEDEAVSATTPQRDGICSLYNDLIGLVMGWLPDTDVLSLAMVNRQFWKVICVGLVHLPMNFSEAKRLSVEVLDPASSIPIVGKQFGGVKTLPLAAQEVDTSMACDISGASLKGLVSTTVVSRELLGGKASVSVDSHLDEHFFVVYDKAITAPRSSASVSTSSAPRRVGIYWDTSFNRSPEAKQQDVAKELELLREILVALAALPSPATVQLNFFGVDSVRVATPDDAKDHKWVLDAVSGCAYDGATDLSHLSGCDSSCDYWLIFSDGLGTLGQAPSSLNTPCFPITTAAVANTRWFKRVAEETGGEFFNLTRKANKQVIAALPGLGRTAQFGFLKAEFNTAEIADVFPRVPQAIAPNERLLLTGRLLTPSASVTLCYGTGTRVQTRRTYQLRQREGEGGLGSRYWASEKASFLQGFPGDEKTEEIIGLGQHFNMVTPGTSLLVLKDLDQFLKHNICPPTTRPELRKQFLERQASKDATVQQTIASKLRSVDTWWSQRIAWWDKHTEMANVSVQLGSSENGRANMRGAPRSRAMRGAPRSRAMRRSAPVNECLSIANECVERFDDSAVLMHADECEEDDDSDDDSAVIMECADMAMKEEDFADIVECKSSMDAPVATMSNASFAAPPPASAPSATAPPPPSAPSATGPTAAPAYQQQQQQQQQRSSGFSSSIKAASWDPNMPYLAALKTALDGANAVNKLTAVIASYRTQRPSFASSPAFYFDVANFFFAQAQEQVEEESKIQWRDAGVLCATSVLELGLENPNLLRIAGYLLDCHGARRIARDVFTQVKALRGEEPQSFRDLALVLTRIVEQKVGALNTAQSDDQDARDEIAALAREAVDNFYQTVVGTWDRRFSEIEVTALVELNSFRAFLATIEWLDPKHYAVDFMSHSDKFLRNLHCDLRISLGWDKDMTDIDMHVVEPTGEEAYYGHRNTRIGGLVSRDFTQGYGPEEYMLKFAVPGNYKITTRYFANHSQDLAGATSLLLSIYTDYGRPGKQKHQQVVLRLNTAKGDVNVGSITVPKKTEAKAETKTANAEKIQNSKQSEGNTKEGKTEEKTEEKKEEKKRASRRRSKSPIAVIASALAGLVSRSSD